MIMATDTTAGSVERFAQALREHGAGPSWISAPWFLAGLLIACGVGLGIWLVLGALAEDRRRQGPAFRRLCAGEPLNGADRRLLARLARAGGIATPASLLISRGCFDHAADRLMRGDRAIRAHLERLRAAIFD